MASRKRSLYKPWVHHTNDLLSSLVARGLKISIPSYQTQPTERPTQAINLSKALPPLPSEEDTESPIWEGPETTNLWAKTETKNRFPIQPSHLKRVGALSTTHPANYPDDIITRSSPSTNSSRTVRPLTGIDLNIDSPLLFDDDDDDDDDDSDEDSCHTPDSATYYPSVNMYSQPGVDFDPEMFGYLARRSPMPMSSGILVKSSIYQSPKQLHMNRQPPRALRHTDRPTGSQKTKTLGSEKVCQHQNIANVNTLREIVHQEQLRHDMYTDYSYDARYESEGSEISELEDTSINIGSLVPKPLAIHRKEMRTPSPSNYPLPQISANPWSYGINELALSNIKTPFVPGDSSRPSSKSSQAPTIASPISSTRSDDPVLPLLLVSQSLPTQKSFSETNGAPSRTDPKANRRLSSKIRDWSSKQSPNIIPNSSRKAEGPDTPTVNKSVFGGLLHSPQVLQKSNGHLHEVVEKAKKTVHIKSADERRREILKNKIVLVGVTDQSPDGRLSEWL